LHDAGDLLEVEQQAKATQLKLLADARDACSSAQAQAAEGGPPAPVVAMLAAVQGAFASLQKLVEGPVNEASEVPTCYSF